MTAPPAGSRPANRAPLLILACLLAAAPCAAVNARVHALIGARIVVAPGEILDGGVLVVRDGIVADVGANAAVPADAWVWNLEGKTIYPGMIDAYVPVGSLAGGKPGTPGKPEAGAGPARAAPQAGASDPVPRVRPETRALDLVRLAEESRRKWREAGFTTIDVVPDSGIFRGRSAVLDLGDGPLNRFVLVPEGEQLVAFEHGGWNDDEYPGSLMGAVAVARQTLLDADWYRRAWQRYRSRPGTERPPVDTALQALGGVAAGRDPVVLVAADVLDDLRLGRLVSEFGLHGRLVGAGDEYRRLPEVRALGMPIVLPVDFPPPPPAKGDAEWEDVSLETLRHWDRAPSNPRWLHDAGVEIALTAWRLDGPGEFREGVRRAMRRGLSEEAALDAVTTVPAKLLGLDARTGSLRRGRIANFLVTDGPLFAKKTRIEQVWVDGDRYVVSEPERLEGEGAYDAEVRAPGLEAPKGSALQLASRGARLEVGGHKAVLREVDVSPEGEVRFVLDAEDLGLAPGPVRLEGTLREGALEAAGDLPGGGRLEISATRKEEKEDEGPDLDQDHPAEPPPHEGGPLDDPGTVLVQHATVWTSGPRGTLEDADLLVHDGKVAAVGKGLTAPGGAEVIDARGKHVTPGLVDDHNHSAIVGGVNEGTQAVTAEVRIGDVIDSETWNIYRELAGGLTTMHLLHGSANPIGGQNAAVKLRWGAPPDGLRFRGAAPTIKFALGENVKQSNWGEKYTTRFPQTRMGVEQVFRERFLAALDYRDAMRRARSGRAKGLPPRRDLELDALVEVLEGKRLVHCHSYRQDEILMLIRVADEFGFHVGTFQHVLEGYKVADEIAAHGAGASTFSDWWAYKFEVYDAIPYNGAILWDRGVVVSFNSDSTELARRLNLEAAKAVKYGGVPRQEALKFVTLNPAIHIGAGDRIGSLEPGKDADFVIWSGDPLSTASRVEQTWIDGLLYFDRQEDLRARGEREAERERLVEKARKAAAGGPSGERGEHAWKPTYFQEDDDGGIVCFPAGRGEAEVGP